MNIRRLVGMSIWLVCLMLFTGQGWAAALQRTVSSRLSTEFDTNPALSPEYPGGVWRSVLEPSYTLTRRVGANELKAGLSLRIERSSNEDLSQNLDGPDAFIDWLRQSDQGEFSIASRYVEIATRDSEIDATGVVPITSTRASRSISGRWNRNLSARGTLSADGAYESVAYKGGGYTNYATKSGGLKLSYAFSELSMTSLKVSGTKYVPASGDPSRSLASATLGVSWKISEYLESSLQAGMTKTSGVKLSKIGAAAVQYTGQRAQLVINAERQFLPSGEGNFVKVDQMTGNWSYDLSERNKAGINLESQKNLSITTNNIRITSGLWLQRILNSSWVARMHFLHTIIKGGRVAGASSNILGISFVYTDSNF